MAEFRPTYITFDCYGTLIDFQMSTMTRMMFADRVDADRLQAFTTDFSAYRFDEALGEWQPYADVIKQALRRCCTRWGLPYHDVEGQHLYETIPTWGPHPDVPAALARVAQAFPLVILSNASDSQIPRNVATLGAPFHAVYTAEQAQAYKPRLRAFEYMIERLGCDPADLLHVSSSLRYDHMSAYDVGNGNFGDVCTYTGLTRGSQTLHSAVQSRASAVLHPISKSCRMVISSRSLSCPQSGQCIGRSIMVSVPFQGDTPDARHRPELPPETPARSRGAAASR